MDPLPNRRMEMVPDNSVTLSDKYTKRSGRILLTGVQAIARLALLQAERDASKGMKTGGYITGYRGSPLGGVDFAFGQIQGLLAERNIVFRAAINEDLAATAIWGSQQVGLEPGANVDGVFGLWYGKAPGLDRAGDAVRHANMAGSSPKGGVVFAIGDDHLAKSSTLPFHSEPMCAALQLPLLYPADVGEILQFGLHGFEMSRVSGCYAGLKILPDVADSTQVVDAEEMAIEFATFDVPSPSQGLHITNTRKPLEKEELHTRYRLPAVHRYVRENHLDRSVWKNHESRIGIVAPGKSWLDLMEMLERLNIDEARARALGIALYKPALVWPLEPAGLLEFAEGLSTLICIEEKSGSVESQARTILYDTQHRPKVFGKSDADGNEYLPAYGDLSAEILIATVGKTLAETTNDADLVADIAKSEPFAKPDDGVMPTPRTAFYCSGCPHNISTQVPEGSRALAGIGCHGMGSRFMPRTSPYTQMGGEGVPWIAQAPFTDEKHVFANLGDGTYFHSGILAIRQAVAANANMTYKILYNSAVAMTGGQPVDGELTVPILVSQLKAEGVSTIVVVTDDPEKYKTDSSLGIKIEHREDLERVQTELRQTQGVSALVYDQMCATERRRQRKRGLLPDPSQRLFINELACEGCGDCSVKSNCISVEPAETWLGRKRRINQSSCNKDFSCARGFCPSFVTINGGALKRRPQTASLDFSNLTLPDPKINLEPHFRMVVAGIGGTGVVTVGAVLAMAAHLENKYASILDLTGLAQKGGAVVSYLHIADNAEIIASLRVSHPSATIVLACDQVVAASNDVLASIAPGKTNLIVNSDIAITSDFIRNPDANSGADALLSRMVRKAGADYVSAFAFTRFAERTFGDAVVSNLMMVGFAMQRGLLPLTAASIERAIEINGASVEKNIEAFRYGRLIATDNEIIKLFPNGNEEIKSEDDLESKRIKFLTDYQNSAYAEQYCAALANIRSAERAVGTAGALSDAAAQALFKLMTYKDEYEVARLFSHPDFTAKLNEQFEGAFEVRYNLAPPLFAKKDPITGHLLKSEFGSWLGRVFPLMARMKVVRGTIWDIFGYTAERRTERQLIKEFEIVLDEVAGTLTIGNFAIAQRIVTSPMQVRGYGHIKDAAVQKYRSELGSLLEQYRNTTVTTLAAE